MLGGNLLIDIWKFRMNKKIIHSANFLIRFVIASFNAALFYEFNPDLSIEVFGLILLQGAAFWILFDPLFNIGIGIGWDYLGQTAYLDRIFPSFWVQLVTKLVFLVLVILFNLNQLPLISW